MKVFLGGTFDDSNWRDLLIPKLKCDYFNPVVEDWTPECQEEELRQREECDYVLYVITPLMIGTYAIAEAVYDSNKRPTKTIFCILVNDSGSQFNYGQIESLKAVSAMIRQKGGESLIINDGKMDDLATYLNI